jgi:hypothetical protein
MFAQSFIDNKLERLSAFRSPYKKQETLKNALAYPSEAPFRVLHSRVSSFPHLKTLD